MSEKDFTTCSTCGSDLVLLFYKDLDENGEQIIDAALVCDVCDGMDSSIEPIDMQDEIWS